LAAFIADQNYAKIVTSTRSNQYQLHNVFIVLQHKVLT
jgi:hypothetical protein